MTQTANLLRAPSTRRDGGRFDAHEIATVWLKAATVSGYDPKLIRMDRWGALIAFLEYGNVHSDFGWEIDHEIPVSHGGSDLLVNLQPLHWRNNRRKLDDRGKSSSVAPLPCGDPSSSGKA